MSSTCVPSLTCTPAAAAAFTRAKSNGARSTIAISTSRNRSVARPARPTASSKLVTRRSMQARAEGGSRCRPFGVMPPPQSLWRGRRFASSRCTRAPCCASRRAAVAPAGPAPITAIVRSRPRALPTVPIVPPVGERARRLATRRSQIGWTKGARRADDVRAGARGLPEKDIGLDTVPALDLYRELEVDPAATPETIEAAWRSLVKRHHPDIAPDRAAAIEKIKRLNLAHDWLSDRALRSTYDLARFR